MLKKIPAKSGKGKIILASIYNLKDFEAARGKGIPR
jgi:hypothetical protein